VFVLKVPTSINIIAANNAIVQVFDTVHKIYTKLISVKNVVFPIVLWYSILNQSIVKPNESDVLP